MQFLHVFIIFYLQILVSLFMIFLLLQLLLSLVLCVIPLLAYFELPLTYLHIDRGMHSFEPFPVCLDCPIRK